MIKIVNVQNGNTVRVDADHVRDFIPLANHMTKLKNFTKGENCVIFQHFKFSFHLMLEQTLSNLMVCLMISQKTTYKSFTNELACCSGY